MQSDVSQLTPVVPRLDQGSAGSAGGSGSRDADTLVFASVPSEESADLRQDYQPVIDILARETGKQIEFRQATDYAAVIEGQTSGQIHIAQYGPLSHVLAQTKGAQINAVARPGGLEGRAARLPVIGIVKAGSPITSLTHSPVRRSASSTRTRSRATSTRPPA